MSRGFLGALAAKAASAATSAIHRPGVGFTPTIPAKDIASRSRRKGNSIGRAALGTSDIIARTIVLPSAASASLILEGHEIDADLLACRHLYEWGAGNRKSCKYMYNDLASLKTFSGLAGSTHDASPGPDLVLILSYFPIILLSLPPVNGIPLHV